MSSFRDSAVFCSTLRSLGVLVNVSYIALLLLLLEPNTTTALRFLKPNELASAAPHASSGLSTSTTLDPWRPPVVNINHFGGPVLSNPIKLYFIWYGNWNESYKMVVRNAVNSISPPHPTKEFPNIVNWWKIVTKYRESPPHGPGVSSLVSIGGETDVFYSRGKNLTYVGYTLRDIVFTAINSSKLPTDHLNGIYILFTDGESNLTDVPGACGFHTHDCFDLKNNASCGLHSHNILWSWIGYPSAANGLLLGCNPFAPGDSNDLPPNYLVDPTGSLDASVNILFHEVAETATDPYQDPFSWIFNQSSNSENGDLCNFVFGEGGYDYCGLSDVYGFNHSNTTFCADYGRLPRDPKTGAVYNLLGIDGSRFLIQQMWSLANKGCQLQLQEPCKAEPVRLSSPKGHIEKGVFVNGFGLQPYAPGENCKWKIAVPKARSITLIFKALGTGFDDLDHLDVFDQNQKLQFTLSAATTYAALSLKVGGSEATISFTSYDGKSPYPRSTGFQIDYVAD